MLPQTLICCLWLPFALILLLIILLALLFGFLSIYRNRQILQQLHDLHDRRLWNSLVLSSGSFPWHLRLVRELNRWIENGRSRYLELYRSEQSLRGQISELSHDLRTPLTSLIGYLDLAQEALEGGKLDKAQQYQNFALGRARALQGLVNQIFELSRYEDPSYRLQLSPLSLRYLIEDQILALHQDFEQRKLHLELILNSNVKIPLAREESERILQNLLQNALRYAATKLRIEHRLQDGLLISEFTNDLTSDEAALLDTEKIFERFYAADPSRHRGSSGLGLYLARLLAERQNGRLTAELLPAGPSEDRPQLCFRLSFPFHPDEA